MPASKRIYTAVAKALNKARETASSDAELILDELMEDLADIFELDNPNFDREKFYNAVNNFPSIIK